MEYKAIGNAMRHYTDSGEEVMTDPQSIDLHAARLELASQARTLGFGQIGVAIITPAFRVAFTLARLVYGVAEATIHLGMTMGLREMVVALVASLAMTTVSSVSRERSSM